MQGLGGHMKAYEIAFAHKVLVDFSQSIFSNWMNQNAKTKCKMSNRFENRTFDSEPYFKMGYFFKFKKFYYELSYTQKLLSLIHFNPFLAT